MTNKEAATVLKNIIPKAGRGSGKTGMILTITEALLKAIVLLEKTEDEEIV